MSGGDRRPSGQQPATPAGVTEVSPRARAAARRVRLALHRRTWVAMWCVSAILSLLYAARHWFGDTEGMPLLRHICEGFVKAIIGTGVYAVVLLPVLYLGTWAWRALSRRWPTPVAGEVAGHPGPYMGFRKVLLLLVAALAGMALAVVLIAAGSAQVYKAYQRSDLAPSVTDARRSAEARQELRRLWRRGLEDPDSLPQVKPRHWQLLREHGRATPEFIEVARVSLSAQLRYQELFWEDAAVALQTGKPFKSPERERVEKELLKEEFANEDEFAENDAMIADIAAGKPVLLADDVIGVMTAELIEATIAAAPRRRAALEELLTPPEGYLVQ